MAKKSSTFFQKKKYLIFIFVVVVAFVGAILLKIGLVSWIGIENKNTVSPTPSSYNAFFFPPTMAPGADLVDGWKTRTDSTYGFSIRYPKNYELVTNKTGWPNAILILYKGRQSYDFVIEVWDTADEYKLKYQTDKKGLTVQMHDGKFFTLLNNNETFEVEDIISTFQLADNDGFFTGNYKNLQFKYPVGWTFQTPELSGELTLRLSKDDHFIISGRRDIGGSQCVYSDTKTEEILPWAEGVKPISDFTELSFGSRVFRRSKIITSSGFFTEKENRTVFSFCQKEPSGVFGSFAFGETFYYDVPENYDENLLKEMDDIVLSAKEISKGEFCGGIAGIQCPSGYGCVLDGNYPDAGGACQKSIK